MQTNSLFNPKGDQPDDDTEHMHVHHIHDHSVNLHINWYDLALAACIATVIIKWVLTR